MVLARWLMVCALGFLFLIMGCQNTREEPQPAQVSREALTESAVEAMKRNAYDFLPKPFTYDELEILIGKLERGRSPVESLPDPPA